MPCDSKGRYWSDVGISQVTPRVASNRLKLGRGKELFSYSFQKERGPADALILDFWVPEL